MYVCFCSVYTRSGYKPAIDVDSELSFDASSRGFGEEGLAIEEDGGDRAKSREVHLLLVVFGC